MLRNCRICVRVKDGHEFEASGLVALLLVLSAIAYAALWVAGWL